MKLLRISFAALTASVSLTFALPARARAEAPVLEQTPPADVATDPAAPGVAGGAGSAGAASIAGAAGSATPEPPAAETAPPVAPAAEPAAAAPARFEGFTVAPTDGYSLRIGGFVQGDGRFFLDDADGRNTFVVRRARLDVRATLSKFFSLRLHTDFADSSLVLLDAFGTVSLIDEIELQVGKMKSPIGLELLQSTRDSLFPERGLPSLLVPNRDVGAVVQGQLLDGVLAYTAGIFNGVPDGANGDSDANDAKDVEGRIFVKPFAQSGLPALAGFGAGIAGSIGDQEGGLPGYRSPGRQTFFQYGDAAVAAGARTRVSPQAYYYFGPLGVLAEYVRSEQAVSDGTTTTDVSASAWQVWGSVVLGGTASYKGAKLDAPLDPAAGTWGALELAARYGELRFDREVFGAGLADPAAVARVARNTGVSLSWWFLTGTRALVSYDNTRFSGDRPTEQVLITRLQVAL